MKITKRQLKEIIKEEMEGLQEPDSFSVRKALSNSIRDEIIGLMEDEKIFPPGEIPQSVIKAVQKTSLRIIDTVKGMD